MKQVILRLYECRMSVQSLCRMMDKVGRLLPCVIYDQCRDANPLLFPLALSLGMA